MHPPSQGCFFSVCIGEKLVDLRAQRFLQPPSLEDAERAGFKEITETDESGVAEFSFPIAQDFLVGLGVVYRVVFSAWVLHGAAF